MKKFITSTFRIVFTLFLIYFALYKAGILNSEGREKFVNLLKNVNFFYVFAALFITFLLNLSSAIKWKMLLDSRSIKVSLSRIYAYYNIGKFFNLILPTSMGGDVVRIFQLGKFTGKKHTAAASVIVERFTGLVTLIIFAIIAVIVNIQKFNHDWLTISLGIGAIGLTFVAWLVISENSYKLLIKFFGEKNKFINKFISKIDKLRKPVLEYKNDKNAIIWAMVNSVLFQLLAILNVWLSSLAFSNEIDLITCFVAVPVIMFIMNIPFSIGGIGLMEFGYVFTFSLFSISPSLSLSTALLIRAKGIIDAIVGGILNIFINKNGSVVEEIQNSKINI
ncbi:MAG: flippase-like domain-containing protein [Ignavibacteriae bacterium]|nr:flippase-like domain-containing protein [Ignavibacteriota bacterium]